RRSDPARRSRGTPPRSSTRLEERSKNAQRPLYPARNEPVSLETRRQQVARVRFTLLGPLEAWVDGERLPLGGAKQRALLAVLLLRPNEVVSSDRLIDELWAERPP